MGGTVHGMGTLTSYTEYGMGTVSRMGTLITTPEELNGMGTVNRMGTLTSDTVNGLGTVNGGSSPTTQAPHRYRASGFTQHAVQSSWKKEGPSTSEIWACVLNFLFSCIDCEIFLTLWSSLVV